MQALLASGQAAKAKLALQSLETEADGGPLPALLRVKANLEIGASALVDAVASARYGVPLYPPIVVNVRLSDQPCLPRRAPDRACMP